jgi:hypothetical protein
MSDPKPAAPSAEDAVLNQVKSALAGAPAAQSDVATLVAALKLLAKDSVTAVEGKAGSGFKDALKGVEGAAHKMVPLAWVMLGVGVAVLYMLAHPLVSAVCKLL